MKKIILLGALAGFIFTSCGSKQEEKKEGSEEAYHEYESADNGASSSPSSSSSEEQSAQEPVPLQDLIAQGEALMNSSDCKTCHTVENRIVGPSYNDVAGKYSFTKENVAMLSEKVITGGAGNWGEIPMTAHVDLAKADSEKMVYYILSLDGEEYQE
jgi:cytochrome c